MIRNEQDTLNHIFHVPKTSISQEIIDDEGKGVTYGVYNQWGLNSHCESWAELYMKEDEVYINHPLTKAPLRTKRTPCCWRGTMETIKEYGDQYQWLYGIIDEEVAEDTFVQS